MAHIHWLGAGLSAVPGVRRLADHGHFLTLWNRTLAKATAALEGTGDHAEAKALDWDALNGNVSAGDVVVSMLPAAMHLRIAQLCLDKGAHFVSSSYVSPEMRELSLQASESGLSLLNEVGLDPGIDHLMAHTLVRNYRRSDQFDPTNQHYFRSYCGGLSEVPNDFRYKFSWSPLGVLKALKSRATWIADGTVQTTDRPWQVVRDYAVALPSGEEVFEAYPNRDSLPFRDDYDMHESWSLTEFVRGTLRLQGWSGAWREIFALVDSAEGLELEALLEQKSAELWEQHRLNENEADRVVLSVELEVQRDGATIWHQRMVMDEIGNKRGSAMARLVSIPVSLGVQAILTEQIPHGVSAAPSDEALINAWFDALRDAGEQIHLDDLMIGASECC